MPPDWSMTPTRGRSALASRTGSKPRTRTVPWSGRRYPSQISTVVVLPAPFGPRMAVTSPRAALRVSPSTAVVWPYRLTSPPISTAGSCGTVLTDASLRSQQGAERAGVDNVGPPREVAVGRLDDRGQHHAAGAEPAVAMLP